MKAFLFFLCILSCSAAPDEEVNYTASTPAGPAVRNFLGISLADSVDFIRWKFKIKDIKEFELNCSYGISKPNTNGFIDEKKVALKGNVKMSDGILSLNANDHSLSMQILNNNIMHLLNADGTMMVGNGGWSYTLNSTTVVPTTEVKLGAKYANFRDSIVFEGRTPCRGVEKLMIGETRPECYKKKWLIYLYKSSPDANLGTYRIGNVEPRTGKWSLKNNDAGKTIYSLDLNNGNTLDLLRVDENIVYIISEKGELLVGDHDFSYSLNRR